MDFNIDLLKKKIIYRSNYRGTKEMDKLLGAFTKKYIDELSTKDLLDLEKLLNIDDDNLYSFYNKLKTDFEFESNNINSLFRNSLTFLIIYFGSQIYLSLILKTTLVASTIL